MIEDRDGTVSLSLSWSKIRSNRSENENDGENSARFKLNFQSSEIPTPFHDSFSRGIYIHTHAHNIVYTFFRLLERLERVLSPSEKRPRRQEGGNSNRVENTANYRPSEQPLPLSSSYKLQQARIPDYFDNGTTRLERISERIVNLRTPMRRPTLKRKNIEIRGYFIFTEVWVEVD